MVLRDFSGESRPVPIPTLATLVPPYHPGATQFLQAMNSKEAEGPPIQKEPVDLSVNKKSSSSPPSSSSCIDLRLHVSRNLHPNAPGDDTSSSADEHSPMSTDMIHRASPSYLSLERIKQASMMNMRLKEDEQVRNKEIFQELDRLKKSRNIRDDDIDV